MAHPKNENSSSEENTKMTQSESESVLVIGEVAVFLHQRLPLTIRDMEARTDLDKKSIIRIRKGEKGCFLITYLRLFRCYFQELKAVFHLVRLLRLLPKCVKEKSCMVVSLVGKEELEHIPVERQIFTWEEE